MQETTTVMLTGYLIFNISVCFSWLRHTRTRYQKNVLCYYCQEDSMHFHVDDKADNILTCISIGVCIGKPPKVSVVLLNYSATASNL
jgi:hypothetical protein